MEMGGGFRADKDEYLHGSLASVDTAYIATAKSASQPSARHRGGSKRSFAC
jgi:hypothetical protein